MLFSFYAVIINTVICLKNISEAVAVFGFGGIIYGLVEVLTRGYTHWTMVLTGGIVFTVLYLINGKFGNTSIILRCLLGCLVITTAEFVVGCIVNIDFGMNVWDYSRQKYNLMGQICPLFSFGWFMICIPAAGMSYFLKKNLR